MKLKELLINNFRALEDIGFPLNPDANVIVGPNAVGKSTILEAIRISKGILAPRTINESISVLQYLGAMSPHMPQQLNIKPLMRNLAAPLQIRTTYSLNDFRTCCVIWLRASTCPTAGRC